MNGESILRAVHRDEPLVAIAWFATSFEASLARGALEAVGIPAFIPYEAFGTFSRGRGAVGGPLGTSGGPETVD
jgi:hypothetical protein